MLHNCRPETRLFLILTGSTRLRPSRNKENDGKNHESRPLEQIFISIILSCQEEKVYENVDDPSIWNFFLKRSVILNN